MADLSVFPFDPQPTPPRGTIVVATVPSAREVAVMVVGLDHALRMTPAEAREMAGNLLTAADEAERGDS